MAFCVCRDRLFFINCFSSGLEVAAHDVPSSFSRISWSPARDRNDCFLLKCEDVFVDFRYTFQPTVVHACSDSECLTIYFIDPVDMTLSRPVNTGISANDVIKCHILAGPTILLEHEAGSTVTVLRAEYVGASDSVRWQTQSVRVPFVNSIVHSVVSVSESLEVFIIGTANTDRGWFALNATSNAPSQPLPKTVEDILLSLPRWLAGETVCLQTMIDNFGFICCVVATVDRQLYLCRPTTAARVLLTDLMSAPTAVKAVMPADLSSATVVVQYDNTDDNGSVWESAYIPLTAADSTPSMLRKYTDVERSLVCLSADSGLDQLLLVRSAAAEPQTYVLEIVSRHSVGDANGFADDKRKAVAVGLKKQLSATVARLEDRQRLLDVKKGMIENAHDVLRSMIPIYERPAVVQPQSHHCAFADVVPLISNGAEQSAAALGSSSILRSSALSADLLAAALGTAETENNVSTNPPPVSASIPPPQPPVERSVQSRSRSAAVVVSSIAVAARGGGRLAFCAEVHNGSSKQLKSVSLMFHHETVHGFEVSCSVLPSLQPLSNGTLSGILAVPQSAVLSQSGRELLLHVMIMFEVGEADSVHAVAADTTVSVSTDFFFCSRIEGPRAAALMMGPITAPFYDAAHVFFLMACRARRDAHHRLTTNICSELHLRILSSSSTEVIMGNYDHCGLFGPAAIGIRCILTRPATEAAAQQNSEQLSLEVQVEDEAFLPAILRSVLRVLPTDLLDVIHAHEPLPIAVEAVRKAIAALHEELSFVADWYSSHLIVGWRENPQLLAEFGPFCQELLCKKQRSTAALADALACFCSECLSRQ